MKTSDFYYDLPEELIAQEPLRERSASRLLVLGKETGDIVHRTFTDLLEYLTPKDCLVFNNTRVIPARLFGRRTGTGGLVETLLLERIEGNCWRALVKPGKKARPGDTLDYGDGEMIGKILDIQEGGVRIIQFEYGGVFERILDRIGVMPLPPYIKKKLEDKGRYQTVYAKYNGSAAAPTAGLHFTEALLSEIDSLGVKKAEITLHVGLGTFRPVKVEDVSGHQMHSEYYSVPEKAADVINRTKADGGRIICVGTTAVRTVETCSKSGVITPGEGMTQIFIYPGYTFQMTDALITNFHLPESTLIMLTAALASRESILGSYREAVRERYRFFSFGDAMLIV